MDLRVAIGVFTSVLLASCGGSSSSGGGTDTSAVAGFYRGEYVLLIERKDGSGSAEAEEASFSAHVSEKGRVTLVFGNRTRIDSVPAVASDGSFEFQVPPEQFTRDSGCDGMVTVTGQANGEEISGGFSGTEVTCNGLPTEIHGTFAAGPDPYMS